ncbi:MAG: gamma-glutamyltransferase family protein [Acidobacteriota bacterium]|nr:gamma-glutamyltransferase family protein [Acidobacteriota bacterium]
MRRTLAAVTVAALAMPGVGAAQRPQSPLRGETRADHAVVTAGRSFAANAGARVMSAGGNAIDGGVASVLAAAVVEISHFGMGGEAPILIYSAREKKVVVINGQGSAPKAATPAHFPGAPAPPGNGPLGATMPAVIDSVALALGTYGTKSFEEVMTPAIELADGFPLYAFLHHYLESERGASEAFESTKKTYYPNGTIPAVGEMFRQPALAATLRVLVAAERQALASGASREAGIRAARDAFYKGDIARRIAAGVQAAGGLITEADLAGYEGRFEEPVRTTYRGYEVYKAGFWNQGPVLLQTLNILEGFDLAAMGAGSADAMHTITEAIKLAYADRDKYYGDPDFAKVPGDVLLSKPYAAERRRLIDPARASLEQRPGSPWDPKFFPVEYSRSMAPPNRVYSTGKNIPEPGDTTAVEVVDRDGNMFSATPSSGWLLGGAFVAGDTGIPMSNRMQAFRLDPNSPNVLAGGKRPRTTLTPTVVLKGGKPFLALGTPGGDSQDQQLLLVLLNIIDFGMDVQAAIEAPRINSLHPESSFDDHSAQPGVLEAERTLSEATRAELERRGHTLRLRPAYGMSTGVVAAGVDPATGRLRGGADPRRERYIISW